jgi:hypothetical protein
MVGELDRDALLELERALQLALAGEPPSAAARHVTELRPLARMLEGIPPKSGETSSMIARKTYDENRPEGSLTSGTLVERHGSWRLVCYRAYGLLDDGRTRGPGTPWRKLRKGERHGGVGTGYTREQVRAAFRQCAEELDKVPACPIYLRWASAKRSGARARGSSTRYPGQSVVYRLYGSWGAALEDSGFGPKRQQDGGDQVDR